MVYLRLTGEGREAYREVLAFRCGCLKEALAGDTGLDGINALLNSVYAGLKQQTAGPGEKIADRPGKERCDQNLEC